MSDLENVQHLLEEAKRAANAGELTSADVLLQDAARIQEAELGPLHPELANTINNLAIVAEMEGRLGDAETYYRRAVAIASASLPADDPMVASSRKNLEDFCRERGLPFDPPAAMPSSQLTKNGSGGPAQNRAETPDIGAADSDVAAPTSGHVTDTRSVPSPATDTADRLSGPTTPRTRSLTIVAIGLLALVVAALLVTRPWSAREAPPDQHAAAALPAAEPATPRPPAPAPAPIEQPHPPRVASGGVSLVTAQLCRTFSTATNWRCDPADQSVAPGPIVLYTRVKSAQEAVVIHRWYRGDTLRKSARLTVLANTTDGYRTYSRQTVKSGENWRVEVRNTAGDLLYEQRVSVR